MEWFRREVSRIAKRIVRTGLLKLFYPGFRRYMDEIMRGDDVVFRNAPCMIIASAPKNAPCREADPWIRHALKIPKDHSVGAVLLFGLPAVSYARGTHPRPMPVDVL